MGVIDRRKLTQLLGLGSSTTIIAPLVTLAALVLLWEGIARLGVVPRYILPAPSVILAYTIDNAGFLWVHAQATILATVLGFLLALAIGLFLATLMVWVRTFEAAVYPLIVITQVIPKVAVAPLLVIYMGFGLEPKIFLAFLVSFFPIVVNAVLGMKSVDREMVELLNTLGATQLQIFQKARFHNAMPYIVEGSKIAIAFSIIGAIVGEFISGSLGLGYVINSATVSLNTVQAFSGLFLLLIIGLALFEIVAVVGNRLIPWASARSSG